MNLESKYITPASDDALVTAVDVADGAQTLKLTTLDFARNLTMAVVDGDSSISAGILTVVGTDDRGDALTEIFTIPTTGSATVTGTSMFKTITSATVSAIDGEDAGDTIALGFGGTVQVFEQVGNFGGITVGKTAAGAITITDQDSKTTRHTIGILKASIVEGDYLMTGSVVSKGLRVVLAAASDVTVFYNRSTSN
jgi:hypothetical protein